MSRTKQKTPVPITADSFLTPKQLAERLHVKVSILPIAPRMLRISEAAIYIGATNWFMEELVREGKIPFIVLGKRRVIDVKDLDAWIEKQKAAA